MSLAASARSHSQQGFRGRTIKPRHNDRFQDTSFEVKSRGLAEAKDGITNDLSNVFRSTARITCMSCSAHLDRSIPAGKFNPEMIEKFFKAEGWEHRSARNWKCPACIKSAKVARKGESPKRADPVIATTQSVVVELGPPIAKMREIAQILSIYYDADKQKYLCGWSDKMVAHAVGVSIADVERVKSKSPSEIIGTDTFDDRLQTAEKTVSDLKQAMDDALAILEKCDSGIRTALADITSLKRQAKPAEALAVAAE